MRKLAGVVVARGETGGVDAEKVAGEQSFVGGGISCGEGLPDAGFEVEKMGEIGHR